jgi:uncharacterized protein YaiI (UPF0178 family)
VLHVFVDADACPVKDEVYRVAGRYELPVTVVANMRMRVPARAGIELQVVPGGFDAADDWIAGHAGHGDIVITADVPLAGRCVSAGARVLAPTGRPFTEENIGDALATRDLLADLRGAGEVTGGPPPFGPRDRSRFLQALDRVVQELRRETGNRP